MRKIAERVGCTIGLLNYWFKSKNELIEAVLDEASTAAVARCAAVLAEPDATLEKVVCEFLPLDGKRTAELRVWLVFWALSIAHPQLRKGYSKRVREIRRQLCEELDERSLVEGDVTPVVDALMSALDGIAVNALADPNYWTRKRQRRTLRWLLERIAPQAVV